MRAERGPRAHLNAKVNAAPTVTLQPLWGWQLTCKGQKTKGLKAQV